MTKFGFGSNGAAQVSKVDMATGARELLSGTLDTNGQPDSSPRVRMAPFDSVLVTVPGELKDRGTGRPMADLRSGAIGGSDAVAVAPDGTWALYAEGSGMWLRYPFFPEPIGGAGLGATRARVVAAAPGSNAVAVAVAGVNTVDNKPGHFVFRVKDGVLETTAIMAPLHRRLVLQPTESTEEPHLLDAVDG